MKGCAAGWLSAAATTDGGWGKVVAARFRTGSEIGGGTLVNASRTSFDVATGVGFAGVTAIGTRLGERR